MSRTVALVRLLRSAILIGAVGFLRMSLLAQAVQAVSQTSSPPAFDVVSIHLMKEDDNTPTHITNSSRSAYLKAVNVNVKALMEVAYDIPDLRMFGGPAWLTSEKFSLEAKADPKVDEQIASLPSEQGKQLKRRMLVALLAERFKLATHTEARDMPVYVMTVAKGGPKLGEAKPNDTPPPREMI